MKPDIVVYTTSICPYCVRAMALLNKKGVPFKEVDVQDNAIREAMIKRSNGRKTVPQIFIGEMHIGGCDDLYSLDKEGKLDVLLGLK